MMRAPLASVLVLACSLAFPTAFVSGCGTQAASLPDYPTPEPVSLEDTDLYRYVMDEEEEGYDEYDYDDEDEYDDEDADADTDADTDTDADGTETGDPE